MKKILLVAYIFLSINCFSQNNISNIIDNFKLGQNFELKTDFEKQNERNGLTTYSYIGNVVYKIGEIEINNINLVVYNNKLMAIEINFGNPYTNDNFDQNEFLNVKNSLLNELGKVNFEKNNPNPQIIVELDWKKELNNINLKRVNFENNTLGLILLRDIKLSENFMANLKQ
ncbi:hypothetical protein [Flavobacterium sp.]|uniref:hypothetical protein n=1 Tax=Flavobacterium sp. TaxID=239 RepID=UPI0008CE55BD|nr:hypothetical protein [Flavobacterium sp.]OGS63477.1 MAG: hypothetical protein A2X07_03745 [Flavobacteria bacterium GWF1_32_7]HBD26603.1 hypothetical protein [Flavobacterium sp.]